MNYALQFDPFEVLGVTGASNLTEIRDAYHAKSKKYHPDAGGDSWAFRVITRSYEILSTARVMGRACEEEEREAARQATRSQQQDQPQREPTSGPRSAGHEMGARVGLMDHDVPKERLVDVEFLLLRFELNDPGDFLMVAARDRNLSCNLSITWPAADSSKVDEAETRRAVTVIEKSVKAALKATRAISHASRADQGRFVSWLSYSTAQEAEKAFQAFRAALKLQGFGVLQTIREVTIPRDWNL